MPKEKQPKQEGTFKDEPENIPDEIIPSYQGDTLRDQYGKAVQDALITANKTREYEIELKLAKGAGWAKQKLYFQRLSGKEQKEVEAKRIAAADLENNLRFQIYLKNKEAMETYSKKLEEAINLYYDAIFRTVWNLTDEQIDNADFEELKMLVQIYQYIKDNPFPKSLRA